MTESNWKAGSEVLAIRLDNLGDVLILEPALRALKRGIAEIRLTLMASPNGSRAAELLPEVDDVIVHRAIWQDAQGTMPLDPTREQALIEELRAYHFDIAVIFTSFSQSPHPAAYICYMAGIPYRIGQSKEFGGGLLTTWVRSGADSQHQVDRNMALIGAMGLPLDGTDIRLEIPAAARISLHQLLAQHGIEPGEEYVVVNPFASCAARTYDLDNMREVIACLAQRTAVVVTGESAHIPKIAQMIGPGLASPTPNRAISLAGLTSVPELATLIDEAALLVTNLTSTTHIASATATPTVLLYPGTEYISQWEPSGCIHETLRNETPCMPCYRFECPLEHECMDIPPEDVIEAGERLLNERRQARARRTA